jgi:threonine dehydrogenase-like Zn-dependent dehydrogenase
MRMIYDADMNIRQGNRSHGIGIDGGQAEYVKVPFADTTLVLSPESVRPELLVLMSDIFPTGYFCASRYLKNMPRSEAEESVVVVVGCGPVGICAIAAALTWCPTVYAVDLVPERLAEAEKIGAKALLLDESVEATIKAATNGRGADVVLEVVGNHDAMQLSLAMVRPFGYISCVGVYLGNYTFSGPTLHAKNMTIAWGRCPVKGIFQESLDCLAKVQDKVGFLCDLHMPLEDASQAYEIFNQRKAHKIILDMP